MSRTTLQSEGTSGGSAEFTATHWSVVLEAGEKGAPSAALALERLCQTYGFPLYANIRRQGHRPHDAQDLTQEFFARFLARNYFSLADRSRGKFRTFLLTSLKQFLVNEWGKGQTAKRGGQQTIISWDEHDAEPRYLAKTEESLGPDKIFEKRWATCLLERVLAWWREEFSTPDKRALFEALKQRLWGEKGAESYQDIAQQLGMTEGAVKVAVHRMRQRYRELLRAEVAQTVASDEDVDEELRYLVSVIRG